jgi:acyl-CoA thioester hydrolase
MSDFKAKFPINIRFSDFDSLGHVNNAVYLTYLEEARVKYFESVIEHHKEIDWWENGIILANININFRKPIDGYFNYFISIRCSRIGTRSFDFTYLITREENGLVEINAEATSVMVCFDYEKKMTVPVYADWIEKMEGFEERKLRAS